MKRLTVAFREGAGEAERRKDDQWAAAKSYNLYISAWSSLCLLQQLPQQNEDGKRQNSALEFQMSKHSNVFLNIPLEDTGDG